MKAVVIHYTGRVQGVGFRFAVKSLTREFDVAGDIRNLPDGRVRMHAQGEAAELDAFVDAIRQSGVAGHIQDEEILTVPCESHLRGFQIVS